MIELRLNDLSPRTKTSASPNKTMMNEDLPWVNEIYASGKSIDPRYK